MTVEAQDKRVVRHRLADRIFHWGNAGAVLVLLGTGFLPVMGIKFPWVTAHWIAGVTVTVLVLFHLVRAVFWQDFWSMAIGRRDIENAKAATGWVLRRHTRPPPLPGKYPLPQKLFHHVLALVMLALIATGGLMLAKIDTPWWTRDPYILSSHQWGLVYVVHGLAAMAVLGMIMVHIYFAVRPEKLWITRSMLYGWITRAELTRHHDTERWRPEDAPDPPEDSGSSQRIYPTLSSNRELPHE